MHVPAMFAETDLAGLDALIERDHCMTLVTVHDGLPQATRRPVLHRRDDERVELRGHFARGNPQSHDPCANAHRLIAADH